MLDSRAEGSSFNILELSSHLKSLNYPSKALFLIENCGKPTNEFIMKSCGCGTYPIPLNHSCNKRFCPVCSKKRQRYLKKRLLPYLDEYPNNPVYSYKFLTISPKNYDNLEEGLIHIRKSFQKFIRKKYISERVRGGFYILEVKGSKDNWNVHLHAILYSRHLDNVFRGSCSCGQSYLKWDRDSKKFYCANSKCNKVYEGTPSDSRLKTEFKACSDRECFIDISKITSKKSVINYCLKYVSMEKGDFSNIEDFALYIVSTYRERMINSFGEFYDFHKKAKSYKIYCKCKKCGEMIYFSFDLEVSRIIRESMEKPPPILEPQRRLFKEDEC